MMATESPQRHSPPSPSTKRPKGILKNSYRHSPERAHSSTAEASSTTSPPLFNTPLSTFPGSPTGAASTDKDITIQNTLQNAGPRRSSSAARPTGSRRQSSNSYAGSHGEQNDDHQRLKWDEANIYLTEQEKSATMKIDEPKTPYAKHYDPAEDEDEIRMLDADDIMVDELDKVRATKAGNNNARSKDDEIPGLSLGEPEEAVPILPESTRGRERKAVHVKDGVEGEKHDDEKHKKFEELRKKHYEMKEVVNLLGHPEALGDGDEEMTGAK